MGGVTATRGRFDLRASLLASLDLGDHVAFVAGARISAPIRRDRCQLALSVFCEAPPTSSYFSVRLGGTLH
jgi:hypothetical protein